MSPERPRPPSATGGLLAVATATFALLGASCGERRPPPRSRLVIGQVSSAVSLDPHLHDDLPTYSCLSHFYGRLVTFGPEMDVRPDLALHWDNPSENLWRFHLRRGVTFHDGRGFGAEDVAATLKRARGMPGSLVRYYADAIEDVRAVREDVVEVQTRYPTPVLLNKLVFVSIVPRGTPWSPISRPVGTGPYRYASGAPGGSIAGERFSGFWGGPPAFDEVEIVPIPDDRERAEAALSGRVDIASWFPESHWRWARQVPTVRPVSRPGLTVIMLGFSLKPGSPFADPRTRRAVAAGLDRARIATRAKTGFAVAMDQIVPPGVFGYCTDLPPIQQDTELARAALEDAGRTGGLDSELLLPDTLDPVGRDVAEQLQRVGVRLKTVSLPWQAFMDRWAAGGSPLVLFAWAAATGDASDAFDELLRPGSNRFGYESAELTRHVELSSRSLHPPTRLGHLMDAMRVIRRDLPVLPLIAGFNLYAVRSDLDWNPRRDRQVYAFDVRPRQ